MKQKDVYGGGYVPRLLLTVGFFLGAESLTFVALGMRTPSTHVDVLDFAFVFATAVIIAIVGIIEARRERPDSVGPHSMGTIVGAILLGVVLGVCAGFVAFWVGNFAPSG
jgi:hypothetical protein